MRHPRYLQAVTQPLKGFTRSTNFVSRTLGPRTAPGWRCMHNPAPTRHRLSKWTQENLGSLRSLLGEGRTAAEAATALGRSRYAVMEVAKYDPQQKGWWTPERPEDVAKFRRHKDPRRLSPGSHNVSEPSVKISKERWKRSEYLKALEMREAGQSFAEIAHELGRSSFAIRQRLLREDEANPVFAPEDFSPEEDEQIRHLRGDGLSFPEIQKAMPHRSLTSIRKRATELNARVIKRTCVPWSDEEIATLRDLGDKGLPWQEIATRLGRSSAPACGYKYRAITKKTGRTQLQSSGTD